METKQQINLSEDNLRLFERLAFNCGVNPTQENFDIVVKNLLLKELSKTRDEVICYNCGKKTDRNDTHMWYHADQDDLICTDCARHIKHTDTAYAGQLVVEEGYNA